MLNLKCRSFIFIPLISLGLSVSDLPAADITRLTLNSAVEIAMSNSYRIKRLEMNIDRTRHWLKAERAGLKSKVSVNLRTPDLNRISDYKWDSILNRDVIIRQNTQRWQGDLSIRQPVILFGYPTNGYVSLNYKMYRYMQKDNGNTDTNYYNRLYIRFEQPLFLPNRLKNDIERAELDLEGSTLNYISDVVGIYEDIGDDYYDIFNRAYKNIIYQAQLENLEQIKNIAIRFAENDSTRSIEQIHTNLEITNVRENLLGNKSALRREFADIKQKLRLNLMDSLFVLPEIEIKPIVINLERAIQYGVNHNPKLQRLQLDKRRREISVESQKGRNSFRVNLEMTYGLEKQNDRFQTMWDEYDNSNSVSVNAYIPIWDWGQRKERIQAELVNVKQNELNIEETIESIKKRIITTATNFNEFLQRSLNMKNSMEIAADITRISINQYESGQVSLQDLLLIVDKQKETEQKFLDVYLDYKRALLDLIVETYYNYEKNVLLLEELNLTDI